MGSKAGLINSSAPYSSISMMVTPEMLKSPHIQLVQVVGASSMIATVRPGSLHDVMTPAEERRTIVFGKPMNCDEDDPQSCVGLNSSALIHAPLEGASVRWQRPLFVSSSYSGEALPVPDWKFSHRLVARIDTSYAMLQPLAVEVAIDLAGVADAVRSAVPEGGATYVVTADGTIIAGSNYKPRAAALYDPMTAIVIYPRIWDLGFKWTTALSSQMLVGTEAVEAWYNTDMVSVRPVAAGDTRGGGYRAGYSDLRLISTAPREVGISTTFRNLAMAAFGVIGAPCAFVLFSLVMFILSSIWWFCLRCMHKYIS